LLERAIAGTPLARAAAPRVPSQPRARV